MREAMLRVVRLAAQAFRDADRLLTSAVREAREHGASWREIGDATDVGEEAARKRWRERP